MMGIGDLFKETSELSVLTGKNNLKISKALHKARIEVTEQGNSAGASPGSDAARFVCNHPFIYIIFDKIEQSVLFAGILRKPTEFV